MGATQITDFMSNELETFLSNELRSKEDVKYTP